MLSVAIHILKELYDYPADYYDYDVPAGIFDQVGPIKDESDLEDIFDQLFSDL